MSSCGIKKKHTELWLNSSWLHSFIGWIMGCMHICTKDKEHWSFSQSRSKAEQCVVADHRVQIRTWNLCFVLYIWCLLNVYFEPDEEYCTGRWETGDWSSCSATCGVGLRTRTVACTHRPSRDSNQTKVLRDEDCQNPKPSPVQACNRFDCPPMWDTRDWEQVKWCSPGGYLTLLQTESYIIPHEMQMPTSVSVSL